MEPQEFKNLVNNIRQTELSIGEATFKLSEKIRQSRTFARSLFAVKDIKSGEVFTNDNIQSIRPAHGLPPKFIDSIIGKTAKTDIKKGTPLNWTLIK
jgi:pseudaminic acid synthase